MEDNTSQQNPVFLSEADFRQAVASLPLISIDICVTDPSHRLLIGLRTNPPARNWWFTPGGRIRKNESQESAIRRIACGELGFSPEALDQLRGRMQLMGAWDHFYPDSAFSPDISTHYVNMPHWLPLSWAELELLNPPLANADAQHAQWQWMPVEEAAASEEVHWFARPYAQWLAEKLRVPIAAVSRSAVGT
ncbi:NUDIX domain-containing protein [Noviherbaspirillum aridicola]|uniref:GDP-mannose mannosyl hydrolase n=1 Tax=Noviherbaspirillum aridicola TaxID=2849687 RepID=A0ABQ4Q2B1_9BURK|nr:NUDIX domain-containing protein [Noviherbaspirillum aridicola]GIZ51323.1 GDP-mannose mannosyl hydrolase [Noviherbaspirillum aridicola]